MCRDHSPALDRRALLRAGVGVTTLAPLATFAPAEAGSSSTRQFSGSFGPDAPDWHYLPVRVPAGVREIEVSYAYTKNDTSLGFSTDVIDLGVFDPSGHDLGDAAGFRGWSGGARTGFRISRGSATPGYLPGPIGAGVWHVVLGPVMIVSPSVEWSVTVTLHFGDPGPAFVPTPPPRRVEGRGAGWYRGDLHLHSVHSDGKWTQPQLIDAARAAGLDFINSSEHNTSSAGLTWGRYAPRDFLVMTGEEITTRAGHWLAVGLPAGTWIDWRYRPADGQLGRFTSKVRSLGGLAIAAHPFVPIPTTKWDFGYDFRQLDAVEIWNGPWTLDDQTGVEHWHARLVAGEFLPIVGNSDSHHSGQKVGLPQTVVKSSALSVGALVAGIRAGRVWIAESSQVDLRFTAAGAGRTATCGDTLTVGATDPVTVRLRVEGVPGCLAQVRGPVGVLAGAVVDASGAATVTATVPAGGVDFVRAEVRRPDGDVVVSPLEDAPLTQMVALTNPIFVRTSTSG